MPTLTTDSGLKYEDLTEGKGEDAQNGTLLRKRRVEAGGNGSGSDGVSGGGCRIDGWGAGRGH